MKRDAMSEDFDDRLRAMLRSAAERTEIAPQSLPARSHRRVLVRQTALVAGLATILVFAILGAIRLSEIFKEDEFAPAAPRVSIVRSARGSGGTYPCSYEQFQGQCVAKGRFRDHAWFIGAYVEDEGDLCVEDALDTAGGRESSGRGCGPYRPDGLGFGLSTSKDSPRKIAYGEVTAHAVRLVLEVEGGADLDLELYPAPEGFPLDVKFYVVFLPQHAGELVAYDASGQEIARQTTESELPGLLKQEERKVREHLQ